jgi:enoyl-CoA hydratase
MKAYRHIVYDRPADGVSRITLARPARLNALHAEATDELLHAERTAMEDSDVVVLIYRGAGRAFCAGRDLKEYPNERTRALAWMNEGGWCRPWLLPKVTVAQVHGYAIGGGALLATCCDITITSPDAGISYPEGWMGMDDIDSHPWTWMVGPKRAQDLLITGRRVSGVEAKELGLATEVVDTSRLEGHVLEVAARVVQAERASSGFPSRAKAAIHEETRVRGLSTDQSVLRWASRNS